MKRYKIGYLGPPGTFSEMAVLLYCQSEDEIIPHKTIRGIVKNVRKGKITAGIIPLENSLEGSVNISMDLLFKESNIKIVGEVILPIEHYLCAPTGVTMDNIKEICSHRQAIAQSDDFVYSNLPGVKITYTESTAAAAELVVKSDNKAMIGSRRISQLYDLDILAENIEGELDNFTRFVIIEDESNNNHNRALCQDEKEEDQKRQYPNKMYKTSIVCTPEVNRPGVLYQILGEFANREIDLTRIESRPTKKRLGEYLFFIDLEGHQDIFELAVALKKVKEKSGFFKVLGSYLKADVIQKEGRSD